MPEVIGVQLLKGGGVHYFLSANEPMPLDAFCVVEGDQGLQVARVVRTAREVTEGHVPPNMKRIIRAATARDHEQLKKNVKKEQEAYKLCREKVAKKKMQMKLVDVGYTLDGRKAVFFFTAENRVDFRELVKELAQALKIKIEMRQIGVRDEARRLGGVGCCGRALCCATFLKDFASVSIRMAKEQNLSLNPTKVSGLCGRLMCCLAYEYEGTGGKGKKKKMTEGKPQEPECCRSLEPDEPILDEESEQDILIEEKKDAVEAKPEESRPSQPKPQQTTDGKNPEKPKNNFRRKRNRHHRKNKKNGA